MSDRIRYVRNLSNWKEYKACKRVVKQKRSLDCNQIYYIHFLDLVFVVVLFVYQLVKCRISLIQNRVLCTSDYAFMASNSVPRVVN